MNRKSTAVTLLLGLSPFLFTSFALAAEKTLSTSASVYTETSRLSSAGSPGWRFGLGTTGRVIADYLSGAHRFRSGYRLTLGGQYKDGLSGDTRVSGASFYRYGLAAGRWDLNAGHNIRSVNAGDGFVIDPDGYITRQAVNLGAGLNFHPGTLTQLRLSNQAGATFYEDSGLNGQTAGATASLQRQLSPISSLTGSVSRTEEYEDYSQRTSRTDNGQAGYQRNLSNGRISIFAGMTRASVEAAGYEAATGQASRHWESSQSNTGLSYRRAVTSSLIELAQPVADDAPEPGGSQTPEEAEVLKVQSLSLRDSVTLQHQTQRLCSLCTAKGSVEVGRNENLTTRLVTYNTDATVELNVSIDTQQSMGMNYRWQAEAGEPTGPLDSQTHSLSANWQRSLAENAQVEAQLSQAWLRAPEGNRNHFSARLSFTQGWVLSNQ